jgi:hypothetical protein
MSKRNNRTAGHKWETDVAKDIRKAGYPFAITTRAGNRRRDAEGIDLCNSDEAENGRMVDDIQLKDTTCIQWKLLLDLEKADKSRKKRRKVLITKLGKTRPDAIRTHIGKFALMFYRDYLELLKVYNAAMAIVDDNITGQEHNEQLKILKEHYNDRYN